MIYLLVTITIHPSYHTITTTIHRPFHRYPLNTGPFHTIHPSRSWALRQDVRRCQDARQTSRQAARQVRPGADQPRLPVRRQAPCRHPGPSDCPKGQAGLRRRRQALSARPRCAPGRSPSSVSAVCCQLLARPSGSSTAHPAVVQLLRRQAPAVRLRRAAVAGRRLPSPGQAPRCWERRWHAAAAPSLLSSLQLCCRRALPLLCWSSALSAHQLAGPSVVVVGLFVVGLRHPSSPSSGAARLPARRRRRLTRLPVAVSSSSSGPSSVLVVVVRPCPRSSIHH